MSRALLLALLTHARPLPRNKRSHACSVALIAARASCVSHRQPFFAAGHELMDGGCLLAQTRACPSSEPCRLREVLQHIRTQKPVRLGTYSGCSRAQFPVRVALSLNRYGPKRYTVPGSHPCPIRHIGSLPAGPLICLARLGCKAGGSRPAMIAKYRCGKACT